MSDELQELLKQTEKAVLDAESQFGSNDARTVTALENYAKVLRAANRIVDAVDAEWRARSIKNQLTKSDSDQWIEKALGQTSSTEETAATASDTTVNRPTDWSVTTPAATESTSTISNTADVESTSAVSTPAAAESTSPVSTPAAAESTSTNLTTADTDSTSTSSTPASADSTSPVSTPVAAESTSTNSTTSAMDSTSPVSTPAAADSSSTSPTQEIDPNERPAPNERPDYLTPPTASAFKSTEPSDVEIEIPLNPPKEPLKFAKGLGKQLIDERIGDASKTITATTPQGSDSLPAKSCPHCKKPVLASDTICGYCQLSLKGQKEDSYTVGFWLRTAAWIIDYMIMYMMQSVIGLVFVILGIIISGGAGEGRELSDLGIAVILILFVVIPLLISLIMEWLYEAMMTASKHQGTVGKILVGIKVTNLQGERIGFWHATARHFAKFLSALPFYLGFMMAGWTEKHQALHDMICSTLVVKREKTEK